MAAVGKVPERDLLLARAELSSTQERLRQTKATRQQATRALELILGRYPKAELALKQQLPAIPPPPPAGLPAELLQRRPDLRASEQRVAAAFNLTESARAARLPKIGLTLGGGAASGDLTNILGGDKAFWNAGANFLAPIYSGGALKAQVEIENARQEQALASYGSLALRAFGEVENALGNEVLLAERQAYLASAVSDFRKVYDLTDEEYRVGKITLFNLLQAQQRFLASQVALVRINSDRLAERVNLHLSLGGDFEL
jgi:outer membrane protein TolC